MLMRRGLIKKNPIQTPVAAISCGVVAGEVRLDLDYEEDSAAEVDANIVLTGQGNLVEVQMSGEEATFTPAQLQQMLEVALTGGQHLLALQKEALR
jgi:ribonuclease PH